MSGRASPPPAEETRSACPGGLLPVSAAAGSAGGAAPTRAPSVQVASAPAPGSAAASAPLAAPSSQPSGCVPIRPRPIGHAPGLPAAAIPIASPGGAAPPAAPRASPVPILPRPSGTAPGRGPAPGGRGTGGGRALVRPPSSGRGAGGSQDFWRAAADAFGRNAPDGRGAGGGRALVHAPSSGRGGAHKAYNRQCARCNQEEDNSRKRFKLCEDENGAACGRWVHTKNCLSLFNTFAHKRKRCCVHQKLGKGQICLCKLCKAKRQRSDATRGGRGVVRGVVTRMRGCPGSGGRGLTQRQRQRQTVYLLPLAHGDESRTVSVRINNSDNRVITSVNEQRNTSCCSRVRCQGQRAGLVAQQQTAQNNGGVASAVGGVCVHAGTAFTHIKEKRAKNATEVKSGEEDFDAAKARVAKLASCGHLSESEHEEVTTLMERAHASGVWVVYETEHNHYAVFDNRNRTTELDYACVKHDTVSAGQAPRRVTSGRNLMCRAVKGEACTEFKLRKRAVCVHTLVVSIFALWGTLDLSAPSTGAGGGSEGSGAPSLPRTPRALFRADGRAYGLRLGNLLAIMSRVRFPASLPPDLSRVDLSPAEGEARKKFVVFERKCTCGGDLLTEGDEAATLVTEAPRITDVLVERRKCSLCGTRAWASSNWRQTAVFNYNDSLLVEVSLLYKCLAQFIGGTPIQNFFFGFLQPLRTDIAWLSENQGFGASVNDKNSRLFVQLTNAFLGFLALVDFPFEFRCYQWGPHSEIITADACVKMSVNQMTKELTKSSRPATTIDFDMQTICLKLSLLSPVAFGERVQFVLGHLEAAGSTPAWISPANRRSERGRKSERGLVKPPTYKFKDGERTKLVTALKGKGWGINQLDTLQLKDLKELHKEVFDTPGTSQNRTKEAYVAKFRELFAQDCSKLFLGGRGGVATAGMVCAFTPAGVMVACKPLPTSESPYDVVDFVGWMTVKPRFLCYDAACKLVKGLNESCPGLLADGGALQRDGEGNAIFPELAHVGNNRYSATRETAPCTPLDEPKRTTSTEDMYAVMEASAPSRSLQSEVDADDALAWAAFHSARVGNPSKLAARRALGALWRDGVRILSLYEVLVFSFYWHRKARASESEGLGGSLVVGADGWVVRAHSSGGDEGGDIITHGDAEEFMRPVLVALSGSRHASNLPALPVWLSANCFSVCVGGVVVGLREYAKAKESFVLDGLQPETPTARARAGVALRGGIGFGRGIFSVKSLELALAHNVAPHETTVDDRVAGYGASFHDRRYDGYDKDPVGVGWPPRKMRVGPDGHHESNHEPECRARHSGMTTCRDIAGVNLTRHESDHGVKAVYFRSINNMTFPNFTYSLRVINELQNAKYNKHYLGVLLDGIVGHPEGSKAGCHAALWTCGRCFCSKPLVRVFDCLGRLDLVFLSSVLASFS